MAIQPRQVYFVEGREVHMMGDYVGVCWNIQASTHRERTQENFGGVKQTVTTTRTVHVRDGGTRNAYIDFLAIEGEGDDAYIDEDSPVEGGLSLNEAEKVNDELSRAIGYLKELLTAEAR